MRDGSVESLLEQKDTFDGRSSPSGHTAWSKTGIARANPLTFFAGRPRRQKIALSAFVATALLLLLVLSRHHKEKPAGPPPFYCSTWDTASEPPASDRESMIRDYNNWARYDQEETPLPPAPVNQVPMKAGNKHSSVLNILPKLREDKPINMAGKEWKKPKGFKIIAMIFYGRPHQVDILDCYLQQNMAQHGGFLDEVHFISHTTDAHALAWLDNLVAATPGYERIEVGPHCHEHPNSEDCRYERIWERFATDADTLYIKIDDDMAYIHPETIPRLVYKRLEFPHPFAISANLVNSPVTSWLHYHTGAIYPYLPEPFPMERTSHKPSWKPSELPVHPDDEQYREFHFEPTSDTSLVNSAMVNDDELYEKFDLPPFPGHRWLPLTQNSTSLLHTPMSRSSVDPWGPSVHSWAIAAQQHYSLLKNIEDQTMHKYWVAPVPPHGDGLWNMQYGRYNLNFIVVWGRDVVEGANVRRVSGPTKYTPTSPSWYSGLGDAWGNGIVSELHDDEKNITADMPRALGRPMMVDVQAVAAHMHFHDQELGIQMTDLLDRWRTYVNENVCAPRRQKSVPGQIGGLGWDKDLGGSGWWKCPWVS